MVFIEADFQQLNALSVTSPHRFPSKVIFPYSQMCFHRILEVNYVCMTVALVHKYHVMSRQSNTDTYSQICKYTLGRHPAIGTMPIQTGV